MISLILIALAAVCNACMDLVENENFHRSIFKNLNQQFWYKRVSWEYAPKILRYKFDFWHICKSLMVIFIVLSIVFYQRIFELYSFPEWITVIINILTFGCVWNLVFSLTYYELRK